jgi:hypothetical protein
MCLTWKSDTFHDNDLLLTYLYKIGNSNSNTSYDKIQTVQICSITHFFIRIFGQYLQHAVPYTMILDNTKSCCYMGKLGEAEAPKVQHIFLML